MENKNEKKLTWLQYQMANRYLYLMILFILAGTLIPLAYGSDYILVLPVCLGISALIFVLAHKAYKIYDKGGTS